MVQPFAIGPRDIEEAAGRIADHVLRTPLVAAPRLSELVEAEVMVKHEDMQATASFKERGTVDKLLLLTGDERARDTIDMFGASLTCRLRAYRSRL